MTEVKYTCKYLGVNQGKKIIARHCERGGVDNENYQNKIRYNALFWNKIEKISEFGSHLSLRGNIIYHYFSSQVEKSS